MSSLVYSPLAWLLAASLLLWVWTMWKTAKGEWRMANAEPKGQRSEIGGQRSEVSNQQSAISDPPSSIIHHPSSIRHHLSALLLFAFLPLWLLVYALSTPLGSDSLRRSLTTHWRVPADFSPDYILVAAMGYVASGDHKGDVLREGTAARIAAAVGWWEDHPQAFLVMQGASGRPELGEDHQGQLMKRFATAYSIPPGQILLEPRSRNTREHVKYFLEFEAVTPATPIGVVTSDWHMRRTAREFRAAFENVQFRATYAPVVRGVTLGNLLPGERNLQQSALYLREWMAIMHYRITGKQ